MTIKNIGNIMIKIFLFISILTTLLLAKNPLAYAVLGDIIYNNVDNIEKLKEIDAYKLYEAEITKYVKDVHEAKENGLLVESPASVISKKEYLATLRELTKVNDYFTRSANASFVLAMKNENNVLFSQMVNSGLIDTQLHKKEILDYYFEHSEDINPSGVIQVYLDDDAKLKEKKEALAKRYKSKVMLEKEKIERIRKNDKLEQERLEQELQKEVKKKKLEIREHQKSELAK